MKNLKKILKEIEDKKETKKNQNGVIIHLKIFN